MKNLLPFLFLLPVLACSSGSSATLDPMSSLPDNGSAASLARLRLDKVP